MDESLSVQMVCEKNRNLLRIEKNVVALAAEWRRK